MRSPHDPPLTARAVRPRRVTFGFPTVCAVLGVAVGYWDSQLSQDYLNLNWIREARLHAAERAPSFVMIGGLIGLTVGLYCERLSKRGEKRSAVFLLAVIIGAVCTIKLIHGNMF
jgi:hypothetical protein